MSFPDRLAIAFDLGTTTIAAALVDPATGARLAAAGALNPQREFGLDVVSRLEAAGRSSENRERMQRLVNEMLQQLIQELLHAVGAGEQSLRFLAVAGNPAMEHFLLGLPVTSLAFPPYRPLFSAGKTITATELGWDAALAAYVFPLPGGFVGGDLVAFLYGAGVTGRHSPGASPRLFLDLGTNGELALVTADAIYATSAAAGPAFEGGNIACGTVVRPGAICDMRLEGEQLTLTTIGNERPCGICGSGVIAVVAELLRSGVVDHTGRLLTPAEIPSNLANRIARHDGETAFILYRDAGGEVYLGQQDIRQVQLAKAAIRAGIEVLCTRAGISGDTVRETVLTGSFGANLVPERLKNIGIFPEKMIEICSFVREGALSGVEKALCAPRGTAAVDRLARAVRVVPLSGTPAFEKHFLEQMNFPKSAA